MSKKPKKMKWFPSETELQQLGFEIVTKWALHNIKGAKLKINDNLFIEISAYPFAVLKTMLGIYNGSENAICYITLKNPESLDELKAQIENFTSSQVNFDQQRIVIYKVK